MSHFLCCFIFGKTLKPGKKLILAIKYLAALLLLSMFRLLQSASNLFTITFV